MKHLYFLYMIIKNMIYRALKLFDLKDLYQIEICNDNNNEIFNNKATEITLSMSCTTCNNCKIIIIKGKTTKKM